MGKRTYPKRLQPKNGRMVNGCWKSDYDQGYDDGLTGGYGNKETPHEFSLTPLHLPARSRDYWSGYRAARLHLLGKDRTTTVKVREKQKRTPTRVMREAQALAEHLLGVDEYRAMLKKGFAPETILAHVGILGEYKAELGRVQHSQRGSLTARA